MKVALVPVAVADPVRFSVGRPRRPGPRVRVNVDPYGRSFGNRVAAARRLLGLTQVQLAEQSGVSRTVVGRIESEETACSCDTLAALAAALETTMDALWRSSDDARPAR